MKLLLGCFLEARKNPWLVLSELRHRNFMADRGRKDGETREAGLRRWVTLQGQSTHRMARPTGSSGRCLADQTRRNVQRESPTSRGHLWCCRSAQTCVGDVTTVRLTLTVGMAGLFQNRARWGPCFKVRSQVVAVTDSVGVAASGAWPSGS